jgi:hypothetical protein
MEASHAGIKGKDFILSWFSIILNLEVGRKPVSLPVSKGL